MIAAGRLPFKTEKMYRFQLEKFKSPHKVMTCVVVFNYYNLRVFVPLLDGRAEGF